MPPACACCAKAGRDPGAAKRYAGLKYAIVVRRDGQLMVARSETMLRTGDDVRLQIEATSTAISTSGPPALVAKSGCCFPTPRSMAATILCGHFSRSPCQKRAGLKLNPPAGQEELLLIVSREKLIEEIPPPAQQQQTYLAMSRPTYATTRDIGFVEEDEAAAGPSPTANSSGTSRPRGHDCR